MPDSITSLIGASERDFKAVGLTVGTPDSWLQEIAASLEHAKIPPAAIKQPDAPSVEAMNMLLFRSISNNLPKNTPT